MTCYIIRSQKNSLTLYWDNTKELWTNQRTAASSFLTVEDAHMTIEHFQLTASEIVAD